MRIKKQIISEMFPATLAMLLSTALYHTAAFAMPAQIVLIRHGEKPDQGNELSQQGCERAFALPSFFLNDRTVLSFGKPVAIYAQAPNGSNSSVRPVQTIAPTANAIGLQIQDPFVRDDFKKLADKILNKSPELDGKTVLISWEHTVIPDFADKLTDDKILDHHNDIQHLNRNKSDFPNKWPGSVFDQAWVIQYSQVLGHKKTLAVTLTVVPEHVVPGDNFQGGKHWGGPPSADPHPPVLSSALIAGCANNNKLNAIVKTWISNPLP